MTRFCRTHRCEMPQSHFRKDGHDSRTGRQQYACREAKRISQTRYNGSEKGKARFLAYDLTERGRARTARYHLTEKGIARALIGSLRRAAAA